MVFISGVNIIHLLVPTGLWSAVNFFHLVGVLVYAKQLKDMAQDIIYSPLRETKGP